MSASTRGTAYREAGWTPSMKTLRISGWTIMIAGRRTISASRSIVETGFGAGCDGSRLFLAFAQAKADRHPQGGAAGSDSDCHHRLRAHIGSKATRYRLRGLVSTIGAGSRLWQLVAKNMQIRAGYRMTFECDAPTPVITMLNVHPSRLADLRSPHHLTTDPFAPSEDHIDVFGNNVTRLTIPRGGATLSCDFIIEDSGQPDRQRPAAQQLGIEHLPAEVIPYLLGSRYCDTENLMQAAWSHFGNVAPGWARVQAIVDFTHAHLTYGYCYARQNRTASDAYQERVGVCRDFAHLAVALCRCMNIPARYCSGYLGDIGIPPIDAPMDFHAWFEVYLEGGWYAFDARHRVPRIGRILMACGRDAADTALTTTFGPARLTRFEVHTEEIVASVREPDEAGGLEVIRLAA
jgi:transglutaminase-like putative cysteine protease